MEYGTGFAFWSADSARDSRELAELSSRGTRRDGSGLLLDSSAATRSPRHEDGEALMAEVFSPDIRSGFEATEAIPSWNTVTPEGSWVEIAVAALGTEGWTRWYEMGTWASTAFPRISRSVSGQRDEDAAVSTDTLVLAWPAKAFRLRARLFALPGVEGTSLQGLGLSWSTSKPARGTNPVGSPAGLRNRILAEVPAWSQMVYPEGGKVWCSPVSLAMVMAYWQGRDSGRLPDEESFIRRTVAGVYDHDYEGHGNWSFNAAWAGEQGLVARVRRHSSLAQLEPWIDAGVPLILSLSWNKDEGRPLSGTPIDSSRGHLTTLVGFDGSGDPVMNEPAAPDDASVRRVYPRSELEARWLESSGGLAYIVHPRS
ncbi:MAG: C39 family peptidase [Spirochaetota bacterium]